MKNLTAYDSLVVLGPTASGKTKLAVALAHHLKTEIISVDSRMVYREMDLGTGKDLNEYFYQNEAIPYHLINLVNPDESYHLYQFQKDFKQAFNQIIQRGKKPILCGGSGLYLEAVIRDFAFTSVPNIKGFKESLAQKTNAELWVLYHSIQDHPFKHIADLSTRKRTLRAIEILHYLEQNPEFELPVSQPLNPFIIGLNPPIDLRKEKIMNRLNKRVKDGMIEEVENLLKNGLGTEKLEFFGLEYKWIAAYLKGEINKEDMLLKLGIAIQQFAKRQSTYFRKMEKAGLDIHWISQAEEVWNILPVCFSKS